MSLVLQLPIWEPTKNAEVTEIRILRHNDIVVVPRIRPHRIIGRTVQTHKGYMARIRIEISQPAYQTARDILIK